MALRSRIAGLSLWSSYEDNSREENYNSKREDHKEEEDQREDERNVIL